MPGAELLDDRLGAAEMGPGKHRAQIMHEQTHEPAKAEIDHPNTDPSKGTTLPPRYDRLSVEDGEIVAAMTAYAPEDSHASGPSGDSSIRHA